MTVSLSRTVRVAVASTVFDAPSGPRPLMWPPAGADEVLDYTLDMTAWLAEVSDTIYQATLCVAPSGSGELAASGLVVIGGQLTAILGPGVPGRSYWVKIEGLTNGGRTFERIVGLKLFPTLETYPPPLPPSSDFSTPIGWNETGGSTPSGGLQSIQIPGDTLITWPAAAGAVVANGPYVVSLSWPWQTGVITSLTASAASGSFVADVLVNSTSVPGLSAVTVSGASPVTTQASPNTLAIGNKVSVVISATSGAPTDATLQINYTHSPV